MVKDNDPNRPDTGAVGDNAGYGDESDSSLLNDSKALYFLTLLSPKGFPKFIGGCVLAIILVIVELVTDKDALPSIIKAIRGIGH